MALVVVVAVVALSDSEDPGGSRQVSVPTSLPAPQPTRTATAGDDETPGMRGCDGTGIGVAARDGTLGQLIRVSLHIPTGCTLEGHALRLRVRVWHADLDGVPRKVVGTTATQLHQVSGSQQGAAVWQLRYRGPCESPFLRVTARIPAIASHESSIPLTDCSDDLSHPTLSVLVPGLGGAPASPRLPASWKAVRDTLHGIAIGIPPGMHRIDHSLTPNLSEPVEVVSLATQPDLPAGGGDCAHMPERAVEHLASTDILIHLQERISTDLDSDEPASQLCSHQLRDTTTACFDNGARITHRRVDFTARGRHFTGYVTLGSAATDQQLETAIEVLNTLTVAPR